MVLDMSDDGAPETNATAVDPVARGVGMGCLGVTVVIAALFGYGALFGGSEDGRDVTTYEAGKQCERFVEDRLKSPSTAEFDLSTTGGPDLFTSSGTVDSQNGFGAMVRSHISCTIRLDGETWRLEKVTGLD